jgi:hypothetical protein
MLRFLSLAPASLRRSLARYVSRRSASSVSTIRNIVGSRVGLMCRPSTSCKDFAPAASIGGTPIGRNTVNRRYSMTVWTVPSSLLARNRPTSRSMARGVPGWDHARTYEHSPDNSLYLAAQLVTRGIGRVMPAHPWRPSAASVPRASPATARSALPDAGHPRASCVSSPNGGRDRPRRGDIPRQDS